MKFGDLVIVKSTCGLDDQYLNWAFNDDEMLDRTVGNETTALVLGVYDDLGPSRTEIAFDAVEYGSMVAVLMNDGVWYIEYSGIQEL